MGSEFKHHAMRCEFSNELRLRLCLISNWKREVAEESARRDYKHHHIQTSGWGGGYVASRREIMRKPHELPKLLLS